MHPGRAGILGFKTGPGWAVKIGLGIGGPLLVAVVWGIFLAPNSSMRLQEPFLLVLELVIFGLAIAALFTTGHQSLAWAFGLIYVINKILLCVWKQ